MVLGPLSVVLGQIFGDAGVSGAGTDLRIWISIMLSLLDIAVSGGIAIVLFRVGQSVRRFERLEDSSDDKIRDLRSGLHEATTKLIDERFRSVTHQVDNACHAMCLSIEELRKRLTEGDGEFDQLGDADHRLELKLATQVSELKDWFRSNFAGKDDLKELNGQVAKLSIEVAVLAQAQRTTDN